MEIYLTELIDKIIGNYGWWGDAEDDYEKLSRLPPNEPNKPL